MPESVGEFVSACFDELRLTQRFVPYIRRAEAAGYPQIAKLFRALAAGEAAREALFRREIPRDVDETGAFYVCPGCGLVYDGEPPAACPVDGTPGDQFTAVR